MSIAALHNAKRAAVKAVLLETIKPQLDEIGSLTERCARRAAFLQNTCAPEAERMIAEVEYDHDSRRLLSLISMLRLTGMAIANGTFDGITIAHDSFLA